MFSLTETNLRGNLKHICCLFKKKKKKNHHQVKNVIAFICNEKPHSSKRSSTDVQSGQCEARGEGVKYLLFHQIVRVIKIKKWNCGPTSHLTAYVIRSGLRALIMHSLWSDVLFFHSCGNFSFSGHSHSTNFFQRLGEPSTSRSRSLNSSIKQRACCWQRKKQQTP